mgnify:CR=1 FL=1
MADYNPSQASLMEELASLKREIAELKAVKTAFDIQNELLKTLVTTVKTTTAPLMLKAVLRQILQISSNLTNAEESSLFLLDADGVVTDSILARGAVIRDLKQNIIGMVLDKGLAGWVIRHRRAGLITDTKYDERWLTLPNQPYTVRSALSIPICRGKVLLGLITLMHSQPRHFSPETALLMQVSADQIALILEHALLYVEHQPSQSKSHPTERQVDEKLHKTQEQPDRIDKLSSIGIYIMFKDGKFMYANPGVAAIFGYTFIEFVTVESIFELVAESSHHSFAKHINQCFQSQSQIKSLSCKFKGQRKDGRLIDVQIYGTKTKFSGKPVIIGTLSSN